MMREAHARLATTARALVVAALMLAVAAGAASVMPAPSAAGPAPDLQSMLPEAFGEWSAAPIAEAVLPKEIDLKRGEAIAYRAYQDRAGRVVTLVAAYGPPLGDSVRLHRPESCYVAQGYRIAERTIAMLDLAGRRAAVIRLSAESPTRAETISYWLRSGEAFTADSTAAQLEVFRKRRNLDGALVRVSSQGRDALLLDLQAGFMRDFAAALDVEGRRLLLGGGA